MINPSHYTSALLQSIIANNPGIFTTEMAMALLYLNCKDDMITDFPEQNIYVVSKPDEVLGAFVLEYRDSDSHEILQVHQLAQDEHDDYYTVEQDIEE